MRVMKLPSEAPGGTTCHLVIWQLSDSPSELQVPPPEKDALGVEQKQGEA